jgi:hypothetical protein
MAPEPQWIDIGLAFTPRVSAQLTQMFNLKEKPVTFTSNVLAGLQYGPYVLGAVQQIEATNAALPGATKKAVVLASVQAAAKVGEQVPEAHVQLISTLIDLLASLLFPHPAIGVVKA